MTVTTTTTAPSSSSCDACLEAHALSSPITSDKKQTPQLVVVPQAARQSESGTCIEHQTGEEETKNTKNNNESKHAWHAFRSATDTPAWLLNPFLTEGYRVELTYTQCVKSLFMPHNELLNIWTALLAGVLFLVQLAYYLHAGRITGGRVSEIMFAVAMTLAFASSMLSAVFHTLLSHSLPTKKFCASLDYWGIFMLGYGTALPGVWYALACHPAAQNGYLAIIAFLIVGGLPFSFNEHVRTNRIIRTSGFVGLSIYGVAFCLHTGYLVGWTSELFVWHVFRPVASFFIFMGVALFFYISRVPERCCPGTFDVWCPSHAIWHVFSSGTMMLVFYQWTELSLFVATAENTCSMM